jgi:hypothetical protein
LSKICRSPAGVAGGGYPFLLILFCSSFFISACATNGPPKWNSLLAIRCGVVWLERGMARGGGRGDVYLSPKRIVPTGYHYHGWGLATPFKTPLRLTVN